MFLLSYMLPVVWGVVLVFTVANRNSIKQPWYSILIASLCGTGAVVRINGYPELGTTIEVLGLLLLIYRFYVHQKWKASRYW